MQIIEETHSSLSAISMTYDSIVETGSILFYKIGEFIGLIAEAAIKLSVDDIVDALSGIILAVLATAYLFNEKLMNYLSGSSSETDIHILTRFVYGESIFGFC